MDIEIGLLTGQDLKSLNHQAGVIKSNLGLATEDIANTIKQIDPFFEYVMKAKSNIVDTFTKVPTLNLNVFMPDFIVKERISKLNYANVRSLNVPYIPDTNARMCDYLEYLESWANVSVGIAQSTIPSAKRFFSAILEDVGSLEGMGISSITSTVITHEKAIGILQDKYRGINLQKPNQIATKPFGQIYSSMKDFEMCCNKLEHITKITSSIDLNKTRKAVKELNEIIAKVVVRAKQKKVNVSDQNMKAIIDMLYQVAQEVSYLATCVIQTDNASNTIEAQIDTLKEFAI